LIELGDRFKGEINELVDPEITTRWPLLIFEDEATPTANTKYLESLYQSDLETNDIGRTNFRIYGKSGPKLGLSYTFPIMIKDTRAFSNLWPEAGGFFVGYPGNMAIIQTELPENLKVRLKQLSELTENWDSYSGRRISRTAINKAKEIILEAKRRCSLSMVEDIFVAPCSDGGIQLEWASESEIELILKISPSLNNIAFLLTSPSGKEKAGTIKRTEDWNKLLDEFCECKG
jgi:hypothetical protein